MDDAVATALVAFFSATSGTPPSHNALYVHVGGRFYRSAADETAVPAYGVFHGLEGVPDTPKNRRSGGNDNTTMRMAFFAANGPDADRAVELARTLFDGQTLTLSDGTTIRLSRGPVLYAVRNDEENPDIAPYRASIDFQYFRQF